MANGTKPLWDVALAGGAVSVSIRVADGVAVRVHEGLNNNRIHEHGPLDVAVVRSPAGRGVAVAR